MSATTTTTARGRITSIREDGTVSFNPSNTNYDLHLVCPNYGGPVETLIEGTIRVTGRKVWTVPSGGLFVTPIFGSPRIIQGRVRSLDNHAMLVHAGCLILIEFPQDDSAFELASGSIEANTLVNITVMPGGRFEPLAAAVEAK